MSLGWVVGTWKRSNYAWIIDKDYSPEVPQGTYQNAVGIHGPSTAPEALLWRLNEGEGEHFQLRYGDPENNKGKEDLCYEGRIVYASPEGPEDEEDFAPLQDFGLGNVGATEIYYKDAQGTWVQL
jgi:hypothetical protein